MDNNLNENLHPIEGLMKSTMENIKSMIDVNTIIGDAVTTSSGIIIPISKVSFGFTSGGSEFPNNKKNENPKDYPFGGISGAGVNVKPVGFLVVKNEQIRFLSADHETSYDRIIDNIPQYIDSLKDFMKKDTKPEEKSV